MDQQDLKARLKKEVRSFYRAGRVSHFLLIGYGLACFVGSGVYYYLVDTLLSFGLFVGLAILGIAQTVVGFKRFLQSFNQFNLAMDSANSDLNYLKTKEHSWVMSRLEKVANMRIYESVFFVASFCLLILYVFMSWNLMHTGTLMGLTLHAAVLLAFDLFMQFRLIEYQRQIEKTMS